MINKPEHPIGPDFDKARGWMIEQERQLTKSQQRGYDKLKQTQDKQRNDQQQKLDSYRRQLEQKARQSRAISELTYHPPVKSADPEVKKIVQKMTTTEKNLTQMKQDHKSERVTLLQTFEQQREQEKSKPAKEQDPSWHKAFEKVAKRENDRDRQRDLSKDFGKLR